MALVNQDLYLEITPGVIPPILNVTEYDENMQVTVHLLQRGQAFEIPSGATATIEGTLAGHPFRVDATVDGSTVTFELTKAMTAYAGRAWTKVKLTKDDKPVSTCGFWLDCDRAGVEADDVISASGFEEQIQTAVNTFFGGMNTAEAALDAHEIFPTFQPGFVRYDTLEFGSGGDHTISDAFYVPPMTVLLVPKISRSRATSLLTLCDASGTPTKCLLRGTSTTNSNGSFVKYPFISGGYVRVGGNKNTAVSAYQHYYLRAIGDDPLLMTQENYAEFNSEEAEMKYWSGPISEGAHWSGVQYMSSYIIVLAKGMTLDYWSCGSSNLQPLSSTDYGYTAYAELEASDPNHIMHRQFTASEDMLVVLSARIAAPTDAMSVILPESKFYGWKVFFKPNYNKPFQNSPLYGKKLCVMGDSLIAGNKLGNDVVWANTLGLKYGMTVTNLGLNGGTVASIDGGTGMVDRLDQIPADSDYIVVCGGANDKRLSVPIGETNSYDKTTFKGAAAEIIRTLHTRCPKAKLLFMTTYWRYTSTNSLGLGDGDYIDAMLDVCKYRITPVFNNGENSGVNFLNEAMRAWMDEAVDIYWNDGSGIVHEDDTHHFSVEGYDWLTPKYEAILNAM